MNLKIKLKNPIGSNVSFKGIYVSIPSIIRINKTDLEEFKLFANALNIEFEVIESDFDKEQEVKTLAVNSEDQSVIQDQVEIKVETKKDIKKKKTKKKS